MVDLEILPETARNQILNSKKKITDPIVKAEETLKSLNKHKNIGKGFAIAIKEMAQTLNIEVEKFCKTKIGSMAIFILGWKIIGKEILGILIILFFIGLAIWSLCRFLMPYKIVNKDKETKTKTVTFMQPYEFYSSDARVCCAIAHVAFFAILLIVAACTLL